MPALRTSSARTSASSPAATTPSILTPLTAAANRMVRILFTKYGHDGVWIESRRGGGNWEFLAIDTVKPMWTNAPSSAPASPRRGNIVCAGGTGGGEWGMESGGGVAVTRSIPVWAHRNAGPASKAALRGSRLTDRSRPDSGRVTAALVKPWTQAHRRLHGKIAVSIDKVPWLVVARRC
jgi:hypothetical protein